MNSNVRNWTQHIDIPVTLRILDLLSEVNGNNTKPVWSITICSIWVGIISIGCAEWMTHGGYYYLPYNYWSRLHFTIFSALILEPKWAALRYFKAWNGGLFCKKKLLLLEEQNGGARILVQERHTYASGSRDEQMLSLMPRDPALRLLFLFPS